MVSKEAIMAMVAGVDLDALVAEDVMQLPYPMTDCNQAYSTDPWATWKVLRKLRREHWCMEIKIADGCRVIMELLRTPPIRVEVNAGTPFEKLPEAICKAALLAMQGGGHART